ncbi:hypothetical protein JQ633_11615 [Bradyrhizobium tropiciagri]|uniref:hypothetical protein n=1 Tax=Bradyrhizobium tropiciagri TaxID=312253 RepID=UPI001BAA1E6D|nr:hypothetical protein [Bradyrhizobium tropiciagri]MBR0871009.1 hypothetical protein [Bradyrhizobium tropiciagri]
MRIAMLVFAGTLAAMTAIAPAQAKSSDRQKADEKSTATSVGCQAYQQAADGSWTQLPCGEPGSGGATQHRSPAKSADGDEH